MSYKKLLKEHGPEELASSYVFPLKLTAKQQRLANLQLSEARRQVQEKMSDLERLTMNLTGLKLRMEDYSVGEQASHEYSFGYFLKLYIEFIGKKRRLFATEIGIDETQLSQLVNQHRIPPDYIAIRLELHTGGYIPAEFWLRVVDKDKERNMIANKPKMLKREKKFVTGGISVG